MGSVYYSLPTFWKICKKAKMKKDIFSKMFYSFKTGDAVEFNAMNVHINRLKQPNRSETLENYAINLKAFDDKNAGYYSDISFCIIAYAYRKCFREPVGNQTIQQLLCKLTKSVLEYSTHELQCADQTELLSSIVNMTEEQYRSDSSFIRQLDSHHLEDVDQEDILALCKKLEDELALFRLIASNWLETQKRTGRYRGYFYTREHGEITEIKNKLLAKDGREMDLYDMLFHYNENNLHSVNLTGKGGSGKSFQILRCIEKVFEMNDQTVPIYVPLSSLGYDTIIPGNCFISFLHKNVGFENPEQDLSALESDAIIFADGLNEISDPDMRHKIARDICELRQRYRTRFLISSRQDHTALFNSLNYGEDKHFTRAKVLELDAVQIDNYLEKVHCCIRYHDIPFAIRSLLKTPQGLVMYAELVGSDLQSVDGIDSLGKLLESYCSSILGIDNRTASLQYESILQRIAYAMVLDETFVIGRDRLVDLIGESSIMKLLEETSPTISVFTLNDESDSEEFTFTHQNYRDYYCAKHFANQINDIQKNNISQKLTEIFKVNNVTTNDEILELTSAFLSDEKASIQRVIDVLRATQGTLEGAFSNNYDFPLKVLIRIFAYAHNNCIAGLNLSYLNLTEVCLNGYALFSADGIKHIELSGSHINLNTFLRPGLPTASSTVCKYKLEDKTYVAVFASKTAMIIDIEENQVQMVRSLPDYGWVNCALVTEYHGSVCILLGCEKDCIALFDPHRLDEKPKRKLIETSYKSDGGIETMIRVSCNGNDYIVFCNTDGVIFIRKLYCESNDEMLEFHLWDSPDKLDAVKALYKKNDMHLACHCALDAPNNRIVIAFGRRLYYIDCNHLSQGVCEYPVNWKGLFPELIKDIRITENFIFLNEGNVISIFSKKDPKPLKIWEYIISRDSVEQQHRTKLQSIKKLTTNDIEQAIKYERTHSQSFEGDIADFFFTKFSPVPSEYYPGEEAVLVGVKTPDKNFYKLIPDFFEIRIKSSDVNATEVKVVPIPGEQRLATFTGEYYKLQSAPSAIHIATTSDDRSVDLITPHNEEIAPLHIQGAYNGVRDLRIVDPDNIVCALYDGAVIHLRKETSAYMNDEFDVLDDLDLFESSDSFDSIVPDEMESVSHEEWIVENVVKVHNEWVWRIEPFAWHTAGLRSVISCSHDRTVKQTELSTGTVGPPIIQGSQVLLDFYTTQDQKDVWAISQNYIYHAQRNGDSWAETIPYFAEQFQFRVLLDLGDDYPYVFYNSGNGTQGYIAQLEENHGLRPVIICERSVFIRKMYTARIGDREYLFIAGTDNKKAYLAAYLKENRDSFNFVSSCCIQEGTEANDFALVDSEYGLTAVIVCKNNRILLCQINSDAQLCPMNTFADVQGQPMCVDAREDFILVGLLNGEIKRIQLTESGCTVSDFAVTHADLLADHRIDLRNCTIIDDKLKFEQQLKAYFTI